MAAMMEGAFRFKPRGSVETADVNRQRGDFVSFLQLLPQLVQFWPAMGQMIGGNPQAARSVLEQALRLFRFPDRQAILGNNADAAMQQAMQPPPAMPGMPPGMPPPGGMMGGPPPGMPQPPMMPPGGGR
jgi:hypothetical protein